MENCQKNKSKIKEKIIEKYRGNKKESYEYIKNRQITNLIYKYRFLIAFIIFIICVVLEISGSSIGKWEDYIRTTNETGNIIGISRQIRADEWAVFTPFAISQEKDKNNEYNYFSNIIRGEKTDVFIVYGQPVKDISIIFRPFQIGYLLLGSSMGLSFYWCGRFIVLFLISFELGMLITKRRKGLSFILAVLISLSPVIQWWFSINGLVEMIIFGELLIILLQKYMTKNNFFKRFIYLIIGAICIGGYLLVFYPAWQIPIAYVFLGLAIWVIIENRKECKIKLKDIISIIVVMLILIMLLLNIFIKSKDTIKSVLNTSYPGDRCETGGEMWKKYFSYPSNLFFSMDEQIESTIENTNVCEEAVFFDLFPIGFILAAIVIFKEKNKDPLLIILLIISLFLGLWCIIGFPNLMAKISLLYVSPAKRAFIAVGLLNLLILIRAMALINKPIKENIALIISILCTLIVETVCIYNYTDYYTLSKILITTGILTILYFLTLIYNNKETIKRIFIGIVLIIFIFMSSLVNPIRRSLNVITENPVGNEIQNLENEDSGLWIVDSLGYPYMNFPIMYGASTINSTNTYPDLDRWIKIDEERKYEYIYNRYAQIVVKIVKDKEAKFEIIVHDSFKVYLPIDKLEELNIKYIFTKRDLEGFESGDLEFQKKYDDYGIKIYKVIYKDNIQKN